MDQVISDIDDTYEDFQASIDIIRDASNDALMQATNIACLAKTALVEARNEASKLAAGAQDDMRALREELEGARNELKFQRENALATAELLGFEPKTSSTRLIQAACLERIRKLVEARQGAANVGTTKTPSPPMAEPMSVENERKARDLHVSLKAFADDVRTRRLFP